MIKLTICNKCGKEYEGTRYQKNCDDCLIETLNKEEEVKCQMCGDVIPGARSTKRYCAICYGLRIREDAKKKAREFTVAWHALDEDEKTRRMKLISDKMLHEEPSEFVKRKLAERKKYRLDNPKPQRTGMPRPCAVCGQRFEPTGSRERTCEKCFYKGRSNKRIIGGYVTR